MGIVGIATLWIALNSAHAAEPESARPNIILISMDTTRADALSCYGQIPDIQRPLGPVTPNLDAFAAEGLRFESFFAHAPTTLSSHTSMHTGLDPHQHGVPRNGYPLLPGTPTLASRLGANGYRTIGVVGASALDREMGIHHGFDVWDDQLTERQSVQFEDRAAGVVGRTLAQLDASEADDPLFLFVHVFDPHGPFKAPLPFTERFVDPDYDGLLSKTGYRRKFAMEAMRRGTLTPEDKDYIASLYLGEVAYVDRHLGHLLEELRRRGLLDHAIVVITADHGEIMGEDPHNAWSHGTDTAEGATRIPLLIRSYGVPIGGPGVVRRQAGMASLAPTLERLAGLERTLGTGPDLWDLIRPGPVDDRDGWPERPTRSVFQEATSPASKRKKGWNNLPLHRRVRAGGAVAEASSSRSRVDVVSGSPELGPVLQRLLEVWDGAAPPFREENMSSTTRAALEALGYLQPTPSQTDTDGLGSTTEGKPR